MENGEWLDSYLSFLGVERNLSQATIQSYEEDLRHFVFWADERGSRIGDLKPEDLDDFLTEIAGREDYSPTSVARHFSSLRGFLKYLLHEKAFPYSTDSLLATPRIGHYLPQYLSREEVDGGHGRCREQRCLERCRSFGEQRQARDVHSGIE